MLWPLCVFLGKTSPCLTVEIIFHSGRGVQSVVRSLRNAAMKKIKAIDFIFLTPFQIPKNICEGANFLQNDFSGEGVWQDVGFNPVRDA